MFIEDFVSRVKGHDDMMWIGETPLTAPLARRSCIMDVWGRIVTLPSTVVDEHTWDELEQLIMDIAADKTSRRINDGTAETETAEAGVEKPEGR